jgi:hypothetical protein
MSAGLGSCQAKEVRRLWSGRLCSSEASRTCAACGKRVCFAHSVWRKDDLFTCAPCRARASGPSPIVPGTEPADAVLDGEAPQERTERRPRTQT